MRHAINRVIVQVLCLMAIGCALPGPICRAAETAAAPVLKIQDLGKGAVVLHGPWQFHLGDDPSFAAPDLDDATGNNGWEQISADAPWGKQGHWNDSGYGWYRIHLDITPASGVAPDWSMLVPQVFDIYSIYWNGRLIVTHGTFPPYAEYTWVDNPQTFSLGPLGNGVLTVRVYRFPPGSTDSGFMGGFAAAPVLGGPGAIATKAAAYKYDWLRGQLFTFATISLQALLMMLALIAWWRDRSQHLLLFTALFCFGGIATFADTRLPLGFSQLLALGLLLPSYAVRDIGLMYLVLWLLDLQRIPSLARWTRIFAIANAIFMLADGAVCVMDWSNPRLTLFCQWADGLITVLYSLTEFWPVVLVLFAIRHRLDTPRWMVAVFACLAQLSFLVPVTLEQGSRFTHWTLGATLMRPLFTLVGNDFDLYTLANFGLLISIGYAVFSYSRNVLIRKQTMEQELRSAQELLQVLIPEALPSLQGFALTSAYQPAAEVGGDFFQILPVKDGTSVVAIGDVSGKGLRAAMAVSLIVGSLRTLVETDPAPAAILAGLNRRLYNRLQGGFATCLVLRLDADGRCTVTNAGHPPPFLNGSELSLAGSLPLGLSESAIWEESPLRLQVQDHLVLYTDGLLEARNAQGEIFSFDRLASLAASRPSAEQALAAAQAFGQDDDITVLTLTRLPVGEMATSEIISTILVQA